VLSYDNFDVALFESLPEFLRKKIESSKEYNDLITAQEKKQEQGDDNIEPPF
jgi:hypothetical protein